MAAPFHYIVDMLKDYLESQGVVVKFPREVIKAAFHYEVIKDGDVWMDMLEKMNQLAHIYVMNH